MLSWSVCRIVPVSVVGQAVGRADAMSHAICRGAPSALQALGASLAAKILAPSSKAAAGTAMW